MVIQPLKWLLKEVGRLKVFLRNKKDPITKFICALLHIQSASLRSIVKVFSIVEDFSHESVRKWALKIAPLLPKPTKKHRDTVAIDETEIKIRGKWVYLWTAVDFATKEVLATMITWQRNMLFAKAFALQMLKACTNKPFVAVDGATWYPCALTKLGLKWKRVKGGVRNCVEQWYAVFKRRTKVFNNCFPCRKAGREFLVAGRFVDAFVGLYNLQLKQGVRSA